MGRRKKPRIVTGQAIDMGHKGMAVCQTGEGEIFLVRHAVPGDRIEARLFRKKKGVWTGETTRLIEESPDRTEPPCRHFYECGGCPWQDLSYEKQLEFKENTVRNAMKRIAGIEVDHFRSILGCQDIFFYRNKLDFSFSARRWLTDTEISSGEDIDDPEALGFHRPGAFDKILNITECLLQPDPSNAIRNFIKKTALELGLSFYNVRKQEGFLRNLIIRTTSVGEVMVVLIVKENDFEKISALLTPVKSRFPEIVSLQYIVNPKLNDSIFDLKPRVFSGQSFITEKLGDKSYHIWPKSFFQTNSRQAKVLYDQILRMGDFQPEETVYDLYCGLGSIGIYLSDHVKKVIGVEEIDEAVEGAQINKDLNEAHNCSFYCGDVRTVLSQEFVENQGRPDTVIVDPPRAGLHRDVTEFILELEPKKIIYVSCNPATQARDLAIWKEKYLCEEMQPVDMFPHTSHIENIARLTLKN